MLYVFGLVGTSIVIIVIYMHIFGLAVVQVSGTSATALRQTYPISGGLIILFGFRGSVAAR